ncbi:MAG: carboxypeptidase-like regulatory domain-containing protein, partial [Acidimicrobiia bacterium]|nr:carboxypeptidase-like regulatory domain-containing protein [Acidimicrobiia bacterium]
MKHSILPLLAACLLVPATALAQSGKIAGQITDASSGEALPGVNVVIDGTQTGATTDADGFYQIINVRPGLYELRATFVGYAPARVEGVRVNIDLTTEVNIALQEEAVGLDEVLVTAEAPIIQRDISGSQQTMTAEDIRAAPFQSVNKALTSQVSINAVSSVNDRPRIRGSSIEESKFIV